MSDEIKIHHEVEKKRFSITVNGEIAGFTEYRERPGSDRWAFVHTEIDPAFSGRGLAGTLVSAALARTVELDHVIVPFCPFVADWLRKHPDFEGEVVWPDGVAE